MSNPSVGGNVGQTSIQARSAGLHNFADHSMSREQAYEAVLIDLDTLTTLKGRERSTAVGTMGRIAESQRAYAEALDRSDPLVSDQALTTAERQRDDIVRAQTEYRQTPEGMAAAPQADKLREAVRLAEVEHDGRRGGRSYADLGPTAADRVTAAEVQALKGIESRHDGLQTVPAGALDAAASREAATRDVAAMNNFNDKTLQDRAYGDDQKKSAAKEDRTAFEFKDRRDDAADGITTRYAKMAHAGLSVKDLQGPALDRLAIMDSRDLLLIDGQPPHPRAGEAKALVAESLKSDAYRATFTREIAKWTTPDAERQPSLAARTPTINSKDGTTQASAAPTDQRQGPKAPDAPDRAGADSNSMRSEGVTTEKCRAIPSLEDRFNVMRIGLVEREYHFRDQAGKVAFTDKFMSISTGSESPAAIKAMVDRAAERGWETVRLNGSPEFVRQGWIAATAQGLKAVGHTATAGDREAAAKERTRLRVSQDMPAQQRPGEAIERVSGDRKTAELGGQRQLAAAIEKALVDGKVSPDLRGQVRAMMTAEGAKRVARGERFKVPVYDARAPRARAKTVQADPQRHGDRERSR